MRTAVVALLGYGLLGANIAAAAPFGLPQGTSIKALKVKERYGRKSFVVQPPKPNPNFVEYVAMATPPHGVCAVTAMTSPFPTFRAAFEKQEEVRKLLSIYGKPTHVRPSERADWLNMAPSQGPVQWKGALPSNLSSIVLETVKEDGAYQVELSYFYKNTAQCSNWEPHQNRQGL